MMWPCETLDLSAGSLRGELGARGHAHLSEDVLEVRLHSALGDKQALADAGVRKSFRHKTRYLELARGEAGPACGGALALATPPEA